MKEDASLQAGHKSYLRIIKFNMLMGKKAQKLITSQSNLEKGYKVK